MKIRASCSLFTLVILFLICGSSYADDSEYSRNTLRGLKCVNIAIVSLREEVVKDGLSTDTIRTDVELKLRLAGTPVLIGKETVQEPWLLVGANVGKSIGGGYIYYIDEALQERVSLVRSPSILSMGETWSTGWLGRTSELREIRDAIKDRVDEFINAYLGVNPKK